MKKLKNYPLNKVWAFDNLRDMLEKRVAMTPDNIAFKYEVKGTIVERTYNEFYLDTVYLGTALSALGYERKHVACIGQNSYNWVVVYLMAMCSNNVFVPIDKDLPEHDLINVLNHSDADIIFCDQKYVEVFERNKEKIEKDLRVVGFGKMQEESDFTALLKEGKEKYDGGDRAFLEAPRMDMDELKDILYTSGTTGMSKGVMLTERNLASCVYYGLQVSDIEESCLSVLPYHHTYEAVCNILVGLHEGTTFCINHNLKQVVNNLTLYKPRYMMLVPAFAELFYSKIQKNIDAGGKRAAFNMLFKVSNFLLGMGIDLRRKLFKSIHKVFGGELQKIICGGAPIRPEIGEFFNGIGVPLIGGYGITECSPLVSLNRDRFNDPSTVGVKLPCIEVEIDEPNEEGIGEIKVKGLTVMMGYYKNPEQTEEVLKDGWFYTGDYGKFTKLNQLVITGRKKNLIVLRNGKNIFPEEIEEYISSIPEVKEVLVYSKKNELGEEKGLTAAVYLDPELPIEYDALRKKVNEVLAPLPTYKQIHELVVEEVEFPKTTSNKIRRQMYIDSKQ